jgi:hypothetical protein
MKGWSSGDTGYPPAENEAWGSRRLLPNDIVGTWKLVSITLEK